MKVVSVIGLALLLPISFSVNASSSYTGHFISGLELGYANKTDTLDYCLPYWDGYWRRLYHSSSQRDQGGINGGAFLGYEILYKKYVFGLESSVNWGNDYLEHKLGTTNGNAIVSTQRNGNYLVSLRCGYTLKNGSILYYRYGMSCVNDKFFVNYKDLNNSPIADSLEVRDINWRWSVGLGVEDFLFNKKNSSIRLEAYVVSGGSPRYYEDNIMDYTLYNHSVVCKVQWVWHFI